jgi:tetratricopeptide (TPR) repeat protein
MTAGQVEAKELEGVFLQHQGVLAEDRNQLERASRLYQQAFQRFQETGDPYGAMQTYGSLGLVEQKAHRLAEARAWYERSHELALQLKNQAGLGRAAQSIGTVCQEEGQAARRRGDEPAARRHFEEARRFVAESLRIEQARGNKPAEAMSLVLLANIDLLLGNLDRAERHALGGLAIDEELQIVRGLPSDYHILSKIAQARGDLVTAAEWAKKRDAARAELESRGGGGGGLPPQMLKALQALTIACAQAGFGDGSLDPDAEEALAQLEGGPAPFPAFAAFLRQIASGQPAPIPSGLPIELHGWLEDLMKEAS